MTRHNFFRKLAAALMLGTMLVPMGLAATPNLKCSSSKEMPEIHRVAKLFFSQ